ncbi:hypothetical protein ACFLYK_04305 [Candidatus Cloacimonadota bacterium]
MKEIVVISGKGGTGKTSITASFTYFGGRDIIVADCDVDAADMHLLLKPDTFRKEDFYSGRIAVIDQDKCVKCNIESMRSPKNLIPRSLLNYQRHLHLCMCRY